MLNRLRSSCAQSVLKLRGGKIKILNSAFLFSSQCATQLAEDVRFSSKYFDFVRPR